MVLLKEECEKIYICGTNIVHPCKLAQFCRGKGSVCVCPINRLQCMLECTRLTSSIGVTTPCLPSQGQKTHVLTTFLVRKCLLKTCSEKQAQQKQQPVLLSKYFYRIAAKINSFQHSGEIFHSKIHPATTL